MGKNKKNEINTIAKNLFEKNVFFRMWYLQILQKIQTE